MTAATGRIIILMCLQNRIKLGSVGHWYQWSIIDITITKLSIQNTEFIIDIWIILDRSNGTVYLICVKCRPISANTAIHVCKYPCSCLNPLHMCIQMSNNNQSSCSIFNTISADFGIFIQQGNLLKWQDTRKSAPGYTKWTCYD